MNPMDEIVQQAMGGGVSSGAGMVPGMTPGVPMGPQGLAGMPGGGAPMMPGGAPLMPGISGGGKEPDDDHLAEAEAVLREARPWMFEAEGDPGEEEDGEASFETEGDFQGILDEAAEELGFDIPDEVDAQEYGHQVAWIAQQTAQQAVQDAVAQTVAPLQQQLAQAEARNQALANATHASAVIAQHAGVPDAAPQLQTIFSQAAMIGIDPVMAMQTPWFAELVMGYVNGRRMSSVAEGLRKGSEPLPVAAHVGGGLPAEAERPEYAAWDRAMSRQFKDVLGMDLSGMKERER